MPVSRVPFHIQVVHSLLKDVLEFEVAALHSFPVIER